MGRQQININLYCLNVLGIQIIENLTEGQSQCFGIHGCVATFLFSYVIFVSFWVASEGLCKYKVKSLFNIKEHRLMWPYGQDQMTLNKKNCHDIVHDQNYYLTKI